MTGIPATRVMTPVIMLISIVTLWTCHHLIPLLNSPSLMCAKAVLLPHDMAETCCWDMEALTQTVIPHNRGNGAAGQAMPSSCEVGVPPYLLVVATHVMGAAIPATASRLLLDPLMVMGLILIKQGAALHCMQVVRAEAAMVTAAIATAGA
jgi:hypothetical protein